PRSTRCAFPLTPAIGCGVIVCAFGRWHRKKRGEVMMGVMDDKQLAINGCEEAVQERVSGTSRDFRGGCSLLMSNEDFSISTRAGRAGDLWRFRHFLTGTAEGARVRLSLHGGYRVPGRLGSGRGSTTGHGLRCLALSDQGARCRSGWLKLAKHR